jgi:RHS repeat-associated protein
MIYVNTEEVKINGQTASKAEEKKMLWDEENRLSAIDINGYVSNYTYDAGGERVTKLSGGGQGIFVNSVFAGGKTSTSDFTLYVNPYLVAQNGGRYTKHIYIGSQRIVSKLGDFDSYGADPRRVEKAGESFSGVKVNYDTKYKKSLEVVKSNYDTFEVPYYGLDNNDYVNGLGFCCNPSGESVSSSSTTGKMTAKNDNAELQQFYYHPDHLGSSSYISNLDGEVVQHVEYVPFGEVFLEEKNAKWNTPYLFTSKELDRETGLYYFGARYQDPKLGVFISVDPLAEKSLSYSSYNYCFNNPVKFIDPDGEYPIITITSQVTGQYGTQKIIGAYSLSNGQYYSLRVPLYKAVITDTEDKNFRQEFMVTRDAWAVMPDDRNSGGKSLRLTNISFDPQGDSEYDAKLQGSYPHGNDTSALRLSKNGSEKLKSQARKNLKGNNVDSSSNVLIHVGAIYENEEEGVVRAGGSESCFGIVNKNNSKTNPSDNQTNKIISTIKEQANKSKTNPGKIKVIINSRQNVQRNKDISVN